MQTRLSGCAQRQRASEWQTTRHTLCGADTAIADFGARHKGKTENKIERVLRWVLSLLVFVTGWKVEARRPEQRLQEGQCDLNLAVRSWLHVSPDFCLCRASSDWSAPCFGNHYSFVAVSRLCLNTAACSFQKPSSSEMPVRGAPPVYYPVGVCPVNDACRRALPRGTRVSLFLPPISVTTRCVNATR